MNSVISQSVGSNGVGEDLPETAIGSPAKDGTTAKLEQSDWASALSNSSSPWEVRFRDSEGNEEEFLYDFHFEAKFKALELAAQPGCRVQLRKCRTDILVADPVTNTFMVVREKMSLRAATRWAADWSKTNRTTGVMLWPHGRKKPKGWKIVYYEPAAR